MPIGCGVYAPCLIGIPIRDSILAKGLEPYLVDNGSGQDLLTWTYLRLLLLCVVPMSRWIFFHVIHDTICHLLDLFLFLVSTEGAYNYYASYNSTPKNYLFITHMFFPLVYLTGLYV